MALGYGRPGKSACVLALNGAHRVAVAAVNERATEGVVSGGDVGVGGALSHTVEAGIPLVGVGSTLAQLLSKLPAVVLASG
jgi:hypothetical protein